MRKIFLILAIFVLAIDSNAQNPDSYWVLPSSTDSLIDGMDTLHYVAINRSIQPQNKLILFFPGTLGKASYYTDLLNTGANLGFHVIGLSYQNPVAIRNICTTSFDTTCHERARTEVWFGNDEHNLINVDTANSIYYRTVRLLQYLDARFPLDDWGQYLGTNDSIIWEKIRVSGHSQGGGHAGFISKLEKVDRCIIFANRDWMAAYQEHANWMQRPGLTDAEDYYGFVHREDANAWGANSEIIVGWSHYGMDNFGSFISVDSLNTPYNNTHMLTSNIQQHPDSNVYNFYHKIIVANDHVPRDSMGVPIYKPTWEYLFGSDIVVSINEITEKHQSVILYPNPTKGLINMELQDYQEPFIITVLNQTGQIILQTNSSASLDLSDQPNGLYFVQIINGNQKETLKIIKQ